MLSVSQCVWGQKREKGCERECEEDTEKWREAELVGLTAKRQDNKLLSLCLKLATGMENVMSQRGAKSAAQYGTAHQNPLELLKTLMINVSAAQSWQGSEFQT